MMTRDAYASWIAASSAEMLRTGRAVPPDTAAVAGAPPNAPNSTFENDRFIAFDISIESRNPDAPSSAPQMIRMLLPSANPVAAAARPQYELSSATTTGMSAPPIGITISTPSSSEMAIIP